MLFAGTSRDGFKAATPTRRRMKLTTITTTGDNQKRQVERQSEPQKEKTGRDQNKPEREAKKNHSNDDRHEARWNCTGALADLRADERQLDAPQFPNLIEKVTQFERRSHVFSSSSRSANQ